MFFTKKLFNKIFLPKIINKNLIIVNKVNNNKIIKNVK